MLQNHNDINWRPVNNVSYRTIKMRGRRVAVIVCPLKKKRLPTCQDPGQRGEGEEVAPEEPLDEDLLLRVQPPLHLVVLNR